MQYLKTGEYKPQPSVTTIANAMDVGDPSNFARILDLYDNHIDEIRKDISAYSFDDTQIKECIKRVYVEADYLLDPHGACGYLALEEGLKEGETGLFLETAHPAKFLETVEKAIGRSIDIPETLQHFMSGKKETVPMSKLFADFKKWLMNK